MANFEGSITNFVAGDNLTLERTITLVSGSSISHAWFTVKRSYSDSDDDAIIQKAITTVTQSGIGVVDDSDHFIIYVLPAETALLTPYSNYRYDMQVRLNTGDISTQELGIITALPQVTQST